jgi:hypothetical protein
MYDMRNTITLRATPELRAALEKRAAVEHKTISDVVREILEHALTERPLAERIGKLRGGLRVAEPDNDWQRRIRERNWRP